MLDAASDSTAYVAARIPHPLLQDVLAKAQDEDRTLSSAIRVALRDWTCDQKTERAATQLARS